VVSAHRFPSRPSARLALLSAALFVWVGLLTPAPGHAQNETATTRIEFLKYGSMATTVALSKNGQYVAIGTRNVPGRGSQVVLWNRFMQKRVQSASFSTNRAPTVAFDSAGTRLAIAPRQSNVRLWHLDDGGSTTPRSSPPAARDVTFGRQGVLGVGTPAPQSGVRVWPDGPDATPNVLTTGTAVQSLSFARTTPTVAFPSGLTQVTVWNYRFNTTKRFNTFEQCSGTVRRVALSPSADAVHVITERRASCDPDYLCTLNAKSGALMTRIRRKNVKNREPLPEGRVAFSRGRYVSTLDLATRQEEIVFQSDNDIKDLSYADGELAIANSDVVILDL
jgi:WD40 repeat protein